MYNYMTNQSQNREIIFIKKTAEMQKNFGEALASSKKVGYNGDEGQKKGGKVVKSGGRSE